MTQHTFTILCDELRPYIERQTTHLREAVSVEQRVAVTIWKLATNCEYRTLSNLFGLGISTVSSIVTETCQVIAEKLLDKYVYIPTGDALKEIVTGFEHYWGFPQAAGAIDGSHVPIIKPLESASDYFNRKGFYSVIIQGLVDFRGLFMDVYIGWPGKVHDARVFANSSVYSKGNKGELFPAWTRKMCGCDVPLVILGDPAYPLLPFVMKPYVENDRTPPDQKLFNYRESRARMVVENAFGRLKGRWRCLLKRLDFKFENVAYITAACVVLHNLCERNGDNFCDDWNDDDFSTQVTVSPTSSAATSSTTRATEIRDAIKKTLAKQ